MLQPGEQKHWQYGQIYGGQTDIPDASKVDPPALLTH
jgi:hypothetical protein